MARVKKIPRAKRIVKTVQKFLRGQAVGRPLKKKERKTFARIARLPGVREAFRRGRKERKRL